MTGTAHRAPAGGQAYTICTGDVASFDGTPLDTDLTLPTGTSGPLPLMVMLHGWGNSKTDFESSTLAGNGTNTWHWNNAWFVAHGFAVLNYTARGFHRSCGQDPQSGYSYLTDPRCSGRASWTHLADRRWEVHDTQYLVGLLVDAGLVQPSRVFVTGDSYGDGQSWLLALSQDKVLLPDGSSVPWTSPKGTPIKLAGAVPQFGWSDLAQALVDNGRASDGYLGAPAAGPHETPIGVGKESYVDGLFADGLGTAQYAGSNDPTADLPGWFAAFAAGEPTYETNPLVAQAINQLEQYRSPWYLPVPPAAAQVPVFTEEGLTDPLFPAEQALQLVHRLLDAGYPVWTFLGDLGHAYAANPHDVWVRANDEANTFVQDVLAGQLPTGLSRFTLMHVACEAGQTASVQTANNYPALASRVLHLSAAQSATVVANPSQVSGPEAQAVDPLTNGALPGTTGGCRSYSGPADPGVASWTWQPGAITLVGGPTVHVTVGLNGTNAELAARLWDVDPTTGEMTLITRAVYRLVGTPGQTMRIAYELWPTGWQLPAGHQLRLELTPNDAPTWRADNLPATLSLSHVSLTVPVQ
jgi:predicted acyl esterase